MTLVVSRGPRKVEVPDVVGRDRGRGGAAARGARAAGRRHRARGRGQGAGHGARQRPRRRAPRSRKGATVTLDGRQGAAAGRGARRARRGRRRGGRRRSRRPASRSAGASRRSTRRRATAWCSTQNPPSGEKRDEGSRVTITVGRFEPPRTSTPTRRHADAGADAVRVVVLAGGRSSEHDVSLDSAATVRDGAGARAGTRSSGCGWSATARGRAGRRAAGARARRRPARRRRRVPGAARPVRRGRHDPGPARAARRPLRRRRRARLLAVHGQDRLQGGAGRRGGAAGRLRRPCARREWREDAAAVRARLAALGLPVFVKPARLGSSVGISKVVGRGRARRRRWRRRSRTTGS